MENNKGGENENADKKILDAVDTTVGAKGAKKEIEF